jgi:hypothetical protein
MPQGSEKSAKVGTYDRSANTLAKDIATTRSASAERIERLSGLVRWSAGKLTAKVMDSVKRPRTLG